MLAVFSDTRDAEEHKTQESGSFGSKRKEHLAGFTSTAQEHKLTHTPATEGLAPGDRQAHLLSWAKRPHWGRGWGWKGSQWRGGPPALGEAGFPAAVGWAWGSAAGCWEAGLIVAGWVCWIQSWAA